jgi:hypothetical protein
VLNSPQLRDNITMRISDMRKLVDGASQELVNLSRCAFAAAAAAAAAAAGDGGGSGSGSGSSSSSMYSY